MPRPKPPTARALAVADRTAGTPEAVEKLFVQTIEPSMRNADREAHAIAALAAEDGIDKIEPWDMTYYSEKVKAREYAVDPEALQSYFELNRVLEDGDVFRRYILAVGGTQPIPEAFKSMTGRTADTAPLLKRRGLA
ncbi:hypothetical protein IR144_04930 [Rothia nasimurium]|nr:hypothetical protein [Rothia nasimurium]